MGQGKKQAKTIVFFSPEKYLVRNISSCICTGVNYFSLFPPLAFPSLVAAEAGAGQPPTASNNNGEPSMGCRIVLAKHSLFDIHCGMFLSFLRYILIVKYTTLIFQSGPGNGEQIWQPHKYSTNQHGV